MVWRYILKALIVIVIIFIVICISNLFKVFKEVYNNRHINTENAGGWVAWGLIAEIALAIILISKLM